LFEQDALARHKRRMGELEEEKVLTVKAVALIDKAIGVVSANGVGRMESTVTNGLRLIFGDPQLAFRVLKKEGKQGNSYYIEVQKGDVSGPILETFGGGVANVVSFLLRVIMIKRFKLARVLICDETFNNVSARILPAVSETLRSLARDGGYTILAVTHQPILASAADHVYRVMADTPEDPPKLVAMKPRDVDE
jgi:DNA repair ATPase RecN